MQEYEEEEIVPKKIGFNKLKRRVQNKAKSGSEYGFLHN